MLTLAGQVVKSGVVEVPVTSIASQQSTVDYNLLKHAATGLIYLPASTHPEGQGKGSHLSISPPQPGQRLFLVGQLSVECRSIVGQGQEYSLSCLVEIGEFHSVPAGPLSNGLQSPG